jgi:hypothetical protein
MWSLGTARTDAHTAGDIKRILIGAHKHHRDYVNRRGSMQTNTSGSDDAE